MMAPLTVDIVMGVETSVWTEEEVDAYQQAMMKYDKDFYLVSKQVRHPLYLCGCVHLFIAKSLRVFSVFVC